MHKPIVQTVLLKRNKFTQSQAIQWILDHNYHYKKLDITKDYFRFRQYDPEPFLKAHYRPRSISLGDDGYLVIMYPPTRA